MTKNTEEQYKQEIGKHKQALKEIKSWRKSSSEVSMNKSEQSGSNEYLYDSKAYRQISSKNSRL